MAQTRKRKTVKRKQTRRTKKPKVYIAPYKVIIFCISIITLCMLLLFVTNIMPGDVLKGTKEPVIQVANNQEKTNENSAKPATGNISAVANSSSSGNSSASVNTASAGANSSASSKTSGANVNSSAVVNASASTQATNSSQTAISSTPATPATASLSSTAVSSVPVNPVTSTNKKENFNFPKAVNSAQLIFVFDDGGQNIKQLQSFLTLKFPITIAVLPQLAHSKESADLIRKSGNELMLHQPMQAVNSSVNPGPGAITPDMDESKIISTLFQNITEIGPIAGFNNHEGSAITADAEKMEVILRVASQEGIYFMDSRTNSETKVPYVAREMGYSYYERNIFLDNEKTRENVLSELNKALVYANKNGSVIMIGHIWSADFLPEILNEVYPELVEKGYTFSTVSKSKARK